MSLSDSNKNDANKMKNPPNGSSDESPMTRLQRSVGGGTPKKTEPETPKPSPVASNPASKPKKEAKPQAESTYTVGKYKFGPAFWTIASLASLAVNIVLIIIVLILLQNFKTVGVTLSTVPKHLLGGLYNNFVKMDQAHIITTIPVSKEIPVVFTLNVSGTTNVSLTDNVKIDGALVTVHTGGLNITNANASIVLPKGTVLPIYIENLQVPVDQKVLAELNVPVDIPLNQTDLHEPFVGLQEVVKPFYCLIEPQAQVDGVNVCQ